MYICYSNTKFCTLIAFCSNRTHTVQWFLQDEDQTRDEPGGGGGRQQGHRFTHQLWNCQSRCFCSTSDNSMIILHVNQAILFVLSLIVYRFKRERFKKMQTMSMEKYWVEKRTLISTVLGHNSYSIDIKRHSPNLDMPLTKLIFFFAV